MSESPTMESRPEARPEDRAHPRFEGRLEASLQVDGGTWRCWVRDISLGGAGLEPAIPAALGKTGMLSSPYFDFEKPLTCRVINLADGRTCVVFDLDEPVRQELLMFIAANTV